MAKREYVSYDLHMKYLSLFTGIGGFELGIEKAYANTQKLRTANARKSTRVQTGNKAGQSKQLPELSDKGLSCIGYSEIDKYAIKVYQSHFPNHKNYGDITKIEASELPDFELLCGGFPCQSFSIAGKRGGFTDTRGTLFFDIARILAVKRPRLLLLENVKGLLSHDQGRTFATIITALDELGYDIQWQVLNSKNHGVPQNRERVLIVGHLRGTHRPEVFPFIGGEEESAYETDEQGCASTLTARGAGGQNRRGNYIVGTYRTHKDGKGFRAISDNVSPTIPARAREDGSGQPVILIREATKIGYAEARKGDSINVSVPNSTTRRGRVGRGLANTLDTGMQQYTYDGMNIRRLLPVECERLQGFPDQWTASISDSQRYKCLGNAVTVNVIADVMERIFVN